MKEIKKKFARELRKAQTSYEEKVWELLRNRRLLGLKFRRQHVIEGFVVDFYCSEHKLAIEVDGGIHDRRKNYDQLRQDVLESKSNVVIRVSNKDIQNNCCALIRKIKKTINPQRSPLSLWERGASLVPAGEGFER